MSKSEVFLHMGKTVENRNYIELNLGRRCMGIVKFITDFVICFTTISSFPVTVMWSVGKAGNCVKHVRK